MATVNRVSATLAQADKDAIMASIGTIKQKLPFLITLSADDRQSLRKLGDKSRAFVLKSMETAIQNPQILPRGFEAEEMKKDVDLFEQLFAIRQALMTLSEMVDDTYMEVGSEAYMAALLVYNYAKAGNIGTGGLDAVVDELGRRFTRKARPVETVAAKAGQTTVVN